MSVNKNFRKQLLEQHKIKRKRSKSTTKTCKIKQLKKKKIDEVSMRLRNTSSEKICWRPTIKVPTNKSHPFSEETNVIRGPSSTSGKAHKNSLYNTPPSPDKGTFDYFKEQKPNREVEAFSKYCDSIMQGITQRDSKAEHLLVNECSQGVSKSLAHIPNVKDKVIGFQSEHSVNVKSSFNDASAKETQSNQTSESSQMLYTDPNLGKTDENSDPGLVNCYIRYSTKGSDKNISIKNSFCIEHL
jgi:hypothetical protein